MEEDELSPRIHQSALRALELSPDGRRQTRVRRATTEGRESDGAAIGNSEDEDTEKSRSYAEGAAMIGSDAEKISKCLRHPRDPPARPEGGRELEAWMADRYWDVLKRVGFRWRSTGIYERILLQEREGDTADRVTHLNPQVMMDLHVLGMLGNRFSMLQMDKFGCRWFTGRRFMRQKEGSYYATNRWGKGEEADKAASRCKVMRKIEHTASGEQKILISQKFRGRGDQISPAQIREARDALQAASWQELANRRSVHDLLAGRTKESAMRSNTLYEEDVDLTDDDGESSEFRNKASVEALDDVFISDWSPPSAAASSRGLRTPPDIQALVSQGLCKLPNAKVVPEGVLNDIARTLLEYAVCLRRTPVTMSANEAYELVHISGRYERESAAADIGPIGSDQRLLRARGPSFKTFRLASHRFESLRWMGSSPYCMQHVSDLLDETEMLSARILTPANIELPYRTQEVLMKAYINVDLMAEDPADLADVQDLLGDHRHLALISALREEQINMLVAVMHKPDPSIARTLVTHLRSARLARGATQTQLRDIFGNDRRTSHRAGIAVHGEAPVLFSCFQPVMDRPYAAAAAVRDQVGSTLEKAQEASMDAFLSIEYPGLSMDSFLAMYDAIHASGRSRSASSIAQYVTSKFLLKQVSELTTVEHPVTVTVDILKKFSIYDLAREPIEAICHAFPILDTDAVLRLKRAARYPPA